ncbi:pancreatic triacylglycerol lipase-like isoform X1 [Schistocerca piceifrons]|uniref:pancreatic triacylglycerol lipase-like isoform X1 n=1 Tax=Schistocerca piceifrons TaxID=274613 RepID=UPI001F5EF8C2|nr:pancreatic triacylglycerol lipase-like isoform X1 [Schistocerca piceifrons]
MPAVRRLLAALLALAATAGVRPEWVIGPCTLELSTNCSSNVVFYLFHSEHPDEPVELRLEDGEQRLDGVFDPRRPTKVIVHGYVGGVDFNVTKMVRQAYLRAGGLNVLVVDWGYLAPSPCYLAAVLNTLHAGRCLAAMLQRLQRIHGGGDGGAPLDVHLVGHSLGAHISAFASNHLQDATGSRVRRITGLDPALPFFATLKSSWKLDPSDADFVDAIHTNAGVFGKIEPSGHADFYVNGGTHQPACREARNEPVCSHLMSAVYFAESVESAAGFWGLPCPSYWQHTLGWCPDGEQARKQAVLMGEHCPTGTRGVFIVETAETPPFALGNQPATTTTTVAPETAADTDYIAQS